MTTIANLRAKFTGDSAGFDRTVAGVTSKISNLVVGIGALTGAAGLGALVTGSLNAADRIQKLRDSTGLTTEFLSAMEQGASMSGASLDLLASSSVRLQRRAAKAAQGTKEYAEAFQLLGLSAEEFTRLSPDDQIRAFADAYSKLESQSERNLVLTTLMGNSAAKLGQFFAGGARGLAKFEQTARDTNQVLSDDTVDAAAMANDEFAKLRDTIGGFFRNLALSFTPQILATIEFLGDVVRNLGRAWDLFQGVGNAIGGVIAAGVQFAQGNFSGAAEIWGSINADSNALFTGQEPPGARGENAAEQAKTNELLARQNETLEGVWVTLRRNNQPVAR